MFRVSFTECILGGKSHVVTLECPKMIGRLNIYVRLF